VVDMVLTFLKEIFKELMVFKDDFGFLLSSRTLKSLSDSQIEEGCGGGSWILSSLPSTTP
jgi:hypothetical protein